MKFSATFLALFLASAQAFTTSPAAWGVSRRMMSDAVAEPEAAAAAEEVVVVEEEAAPAAPPAPLSGLSIPDVRQAVANIDKDNFTQTLDDLESFLTHEAGSSIYAKSMRRLATKAKEIGMELPAGYALEAKATQKKREKQHAFIQGKEEERMAAEAEAAAAPAEEESVEEEAAPAEETEEEAAPVEA